MAATNVNPGLNSTRYDPIGALERLRDWAASATPESNKLFKLRKSPDLNAKWGDLSEPLLERSVRVLPSLSVSEAKKLKGEIRAALSQASDEHLDDFLTRMSIEAEDEARIDLLLQLLPQERLQTLAEQKMEALHSLSRAIASYAEKPPAPTDAQRSEVFKKLRSQEPYLLAVLHHFFDIFEALIHPFKLGHKPADPREAYTLLKSYYQFFTAPLILVTLLSAVLFSTAHVALAFGAVALLGLGVTVAYYKWLKPAPSELRPFRNLTQEADGLSPVIGRDAVIERAIKALGSLSSHDANPLLVGKPGVGKRSIVEGIAQEIAEGRAPQLKGKKLFYADAAAILGSHKDYAAVQNLDTILAGIKGFEGDVILALDNFQLFCSKSYDLVAAHLKELLNKGPHSLHIVGLTDPEGLKSLAQNPELLSRFNLIDVAPASDALTLRILRAAASRIAPDVIVSTEALEEAIRLSGKMRSAPAQPASATAFLTFALTQIQQELQNDAPALCNKRALLDDADDAIHLLHQKGKGPDTPEGLKAQMERAQLKAEIAQLEALQKDEKQALKRLGKAAAVQRRSERRVREIAAALHDKTIRLSKGEKARLEKEFALTEYYLLPGYKQKIAGILSQIKLLPAQLDETYVRKIIENAKEYGLDSDKKKERKRASRGIIRPEQSTTRLYGRAHRLSQRPVQRRQNHASQSVATLF